ncbi:hypothetical protein [Nakamurella leprariae]|uniref:Uncharacterized protein n=1 Tax=Nakamurella leprariae TaxID=2803911 RepID=A0A938YHF3_9ACTN|nr:hypothetical protein [Nakamurella leprariae]MBM9468179.1 hypothetical protein [Nakamurella leprariae]
MPRSSLPHRVRPRRARQRDVLRRPASGAAATVAGVLGGLLVAVSPVAASTTAAAPVDATCTLTPIQDRTRVSDATVQQLVDASVTAAAAMDVVQSVAVLDRDDGHLIASSGAHRLVNAESMVKLYTAAYYLAQAGGRPDADLLAQLEALITMSDSQVQIDLWQPDIIETVVDRYGLSDSTNGPSSGPNSWGSDRVSAQDLAQFLAAAAADPEVGPWLMDWMSRTEPEGADTFDQRFGLNAVAGDHGSKQGWSDPEWTPYNLHSAGWTGDWWVAVLQTSPTASTATMRSTSTCLAQSLSGGQRRSAAATGSTGAAEPDLDDRLVAELDDAVRAVQRLLTLVGETGTAAPTSATG